MTTPVCGTNPDKQFCPDTYGGFKRLAHQEQNNVSEIIQKKDNSITLHIGTQAVVIRNRHRDTSIKLRDQWRYPDDSFVCFNTVSGSSSLFYDEAQMASDFSAVLDEKYDTVDAVIIYMDLRNDVVIIEEFADNFAYMKESFDSVQWIFTGATSNKHALKIDATLPYAEIATNKVNGAIEVSDNINYNVDMGAGLWLPLPWSSGAPKNVEPDRDFLLYNPGSRSEQGSHNFYYPTWIQSVGIDHVLDEQEKTAHLELIDDNTISDAPVTTGFNTEIDIIVGVKGSCAIDLSGNQFYSYRSIKNTGISKLIINGVERAIPTEKIRERNPDGTLSDPQTSAYTAYYPTAPI